MNDCVEQREKLRLQALIELGIIDSAPDAEFDAVVRAASLVCFTPISLISLVDEDRQWFKANIGLDDVSETPRSVAFCAETIVRNDVLEIPDATQHPTYATNPLVTGEPHIRFYAGVPLRLADGAVIGTLCVIDRVARTLEPRQRDVLLCLAECASIALQNWRIRRVAAEQEGSLRINREFLDRTGRIAGVGGWELNLMTKRVFWSAETRRLHGVTADFEPTLKQAIAFYAPEARPLIEAAVATAASGGGGWDMELPFIRADGAQLWVRSVGEATIVDGIATRISGAFQDVSDRVAERAALRAAYQRDTALFHNSPDILFTVTIDQTRQCHFESFNPALPKVTGWHAGEMIGRSAAACLPADAARQIDEIYERCIAQSRTITFELHCATRLGQREFEGAVTPIHAATGAIERLCGVLRDVTEHNRMQAELQHRQRASIIGRLAAGVAHDFNNILQSISGSLELVLDETDPGTPTHDIAAVGLRSANRGAYLTHHLLSYARKQILRPQPVEVGALLLDVQKLLARTLGPHIAVAVRADPGLPRVNVDRSQLQTALLNLAINAAHAMPHAGTLSMHARAALQDPSPSVVIRIADTGCGMDAATLAQAVEPFFTTRGLAGTGLGLSMVQGFAEQSGGSFKIDSTPGQGTVVELHLPAIPRPGSISAPSAPAAEARPTLLVVDDDPDVLATTAAFLDRDGFTILQAGNAADAMNMLADAIRVDAIVTDYAMPGLTGAELITEARLTRPDLPAIIITGFADLSATALPGGRTIVLHKPFRLSELIDALGHVMAKGLQLQEA